MSDMEDFLSAAQADALEALADWAEANGCPPDQPIGEWLESQGWDPYDVAAELWAGLPQSVR